MLSPKIYAVLIVKNEEAMLARCLDSIKGVDGIYIVDTGSEDNTVEIAKKYTQNVFIDYKWKDSFCDARNNVLNRVPMDDNTWCLSIDADEVLEDFSKVRQTVEVAHATGARVVDIMLHSENREGNPVQKHNFPRLFKRDPKVFWLGVAHNHISLKPDFMSNIVITYGYSPAHQKDPDRTLRILSKHVAEDPTPRETYYLAREQWYRAMYPECIKNLEDYVLKSVFLAEQADAYLMLARCYHLIGEWTKAREACGKAILINANFKEAILFMVTLAGKGSANEIWEANARQWEKMAETANSEYVLFKRV